jgi:hypothetical protein
VKLKDFYEWFDEAMAEAGGMRKDFVLSSTFVSATC